MIDERRHRELGDLCKCGHAYGDHAATGSMKCLHGYSPPWWKNTPDMIRCATKCQAFEAAEIENDRSSLVSMLIARGE